MIPVITLVGRQNVGKSTLFNLLTHTRDAIVSNCPGSTRDRKYGKAYFSGQEFIIIDTGGMNNSKNGIENNITYQTTVAIKEADIVFFLIDARSELMPIDYNIAQNLRSLNKYIYLIANKIDGLDVNLSLNHCYELGIKNIYPITASHGKGISKLIEKVSMNYSIQKSFNNINFFKEKVNTVDTIKDKILIEKNRIKKVFNPCLLQIKLAIVGSPNVGKSTLINRILGENRVVVYDIPGTTRDSIYISMKRNKYEYILIDTAGIRKRSKVNKTVEKFSIIKTLESIKNSNVVLLVIDAMQGISNQELSLLSFILKIGRSVIIVVNKWDNLLQDNRQTIKNILNFRLGFANFINIHFISALYGSGIKKLFKSIHESYELATRKIGTALLTRIMKAAEEEHYPPLIRGRKVKLQYAHVGGYNPLIVIIHGKQVTDLPDSYERYLINYFRKKLKINGTPIKIRFKEDYNPYVNKIKN
ncbi:GTPase Der [Candidatus Arsenophonus lipoptenae]|uniref:GTPase Der n=1 Tax=Candidatus Arsenophonus lipoptenae TaxID=634113 RepID=A0A0X9VYF4_9GAMM|nr:ribosome biogenesis GTPase Der [Candidatus Arsenophonus lipoptenae]AMA64700.1 GTPase Der [Candidatus Arsenophonus lipoptenae]